MTWVPAASLLVLCSLHPATAMPSIHTPPLPPPPTRSQHLGPLPRHPQPTHSLLSALAVIRISGPSSLNVLPPDSRPSPAPNLHHYTTPPYSAIPPPPKPRCALLRPHYHPHLRNPSMHPKHALRLSRGICPSGAAVVSNTETAGWLPQLPRHGTNGGV